MDNRQLARDMFGPADQLDLDGWMKYLAEDVSFRFANAEPLHGRKAVTAAIGPFFESLGGLKHDVVSDWAVGDTVIQDLVVTYTRHDGSTLTVPAANILSVRDEKIGDYRIYVDISQLHTAE
jgi:ketosteroid isomerase-like protein